MKFQKLLVFSLAALAAVSAAWADEPFRLHRYDAYKAIPPTTEGSQTIFMGNSITNMHEWWEGFGSDASICNRGNSGGYAYELITNVESVLESKPAKFFIGIGTNDLNSGRTPAATALDIETLVKRVHISSPNTKIYVQSILPRTGDAVYANVQATNALVKAFIEKEGSQYNAEFIDLTDAMMGIRTQYGYTSTSYSGEGLHPTGYGYREWVKAIKDKVNGQSGYVTTVDNYFGGLANAHGMRLSQFGMLPVGEGDVLILGDELIHGGEWHELLGASNVKSRGTGWGYGGFALTSAVNWLQGCLGNNDQQNDPKQMFLYFGVADANSASTEALQATFKTNYQAVIAKAHELAPNTPLYIMSLVPTSGTLAYVKACNEKLKEIADEDSLVTYVDIFTPLLNSSETQDTQYFTSNYLYAKGYVKVANILAEHIEGATKIDEDKFAAYYTNRTNRNSVGAQLNTLLKITTGSEVNQYSTSADANIKSGIASISGILTSGSSVTTDDVTSATTTVSSTIETIGQYLNMPTASTADGTAHWYRLTSQRGSKVITAQADGSTQGSTAQADASVGDELWKFVAREDGTYDIINSMYGTYLAPTSPITHTATVPANGWTLSYSTYAMGSYVLTNGTAAQINQSNSTGVLNWGLTNGAPNRTDQGCAYNLDEYTGTIYPADAVIDSGWYTIDVASGLTSYINSDTNHLLNADTEYMQNNTNCYPLSIGAKPDEASEAKAFIHITASGTSLTSRVFQFTAMNGHGVQSNCTASATSVLTSGNPAITTSDFANRIYVIGKWSNYAPNDANGVVYVGQMSNSNNTFQLTKVSDETLAKYDIWNVSILNSTAATLPINNTKVTLKDVENAGLSTVYNGGYFFIPAGTELTTDNFTVENSNAETSTVTPVISINKYSHTIYVDYTATALATGWYTIDLSTGNGTVTSSQSSDFSSRIEANAHHVLNLDTDAKQNTTNYYALTVGAIPEDAPAKAFIKVTRIGTGAAAYAVTSANGHGLNASMISERTPIASATANFTSTADDLYNIQYWSTYNLNGTTIIGRASSYTNYFTVKPADTSAYDAYTVEIKNQVNASEVGLDPQVTISSSDNKGLSKAYDGGVFFVNKGATITTDQLSASANNGVTTPRITIAGNVITVDYAAESSFLHEQMVDDDASANATGIYDLTGRKLNKISRPGVYIVNGKKTIMK